MAALARDPAARPPTVEDFAHSLRQALEAGEAIEASTPPRTEGGLLGKMRSLLRKKDAD